MLHPYFDPEFDIHWLYAKLVIPPRGRPVAEFEVRLAQSDPSLQARLESHMKVFCLFDRFRVLAGQALNNFEVLVESPLGSAMDLTAARAHLTSCATQQSGGRVNSWEYAVFEAMVNDECYLRTCLNLA